MYDVLYRLGFTPWEAAARLHPDLANTLFAQEEAAHPAPRGVALDLGCGRGEHTRELAERGWSAVGVDASAVAVEQARSLAAGSGLDVRFVRGDVTELQRLGLPQGGVELFLDIGCYHGLGAGDRARYFAGVTALATPDATLVLVAMDRAPGRWGVGATAEEVGAHLPTWRLLGTEAISLAGLRGPLGRARFRVLRFGRGGSGRPVGG